MNGNGRDDGKRERASEIIGLLRNPHNYNYTNKMIANGVANFGYKSPGGSGGVDQSTISRLANPDNRWSISDSLLMALEAVICVGVIRVGGV